MSKKTRLIKTNVFVCHDQLSRLDSADLSELQETLRNYISKRGKGQDCVSILRIIPTLASENSIDIELVAFAEDIDFIHETDASDGLQNILDNYLDIEIGHFTIKQVTDPVVIIGDLG